MDAFVEEVLSVARTSQGKHPLIKRLSNGSNHGTSTRELANPLQKFIPHELPPTQKNPIPNDATGAFPYVPQGAYEYPQRPGFPSALDLTTMMRTCSNDFQHPTSFDSRQSEWFDYNVPAPYQLVEESIYEGATYVDGGYGQQHPQQQLQSPSTTPQSFLSYGNNVVVPQQFYDNLGTQGIVSYHQSAPQGVVKITTGENVVLTASTDVSARLPLKT